MTNTKRKALFGLHNEVVYESFSRMAKKMGELTVDRARDQNEMLEKAQSETYQVYLMDLNLGSPASEDITPAREVYNLVRQRVENGEAKFLAISGIPEPVDSARAEGIPAENKTDFPSIILPFFKD